MLIASSAFMPSMLPKRDLQRLTLTANIMTITARSDAMPMLLRAAALTGYAALAREFGLDPLRLVAAVGLPARVLTDPELHVAAGRVGRLLELSATAAGRDDFGLRLGAMRDPSNLG